MTFIRHKEGSGISLLNLLSSLGFLLPAALPSWTSHQSLACLGPSKGYADLFATLLPHLCWEITFPGLWLPSLPLLLQGWEGKSGQGWVGQGWAGEASWALFVLGFFFINWSFIQKVWWLQGQSQLQAFVRGFSRDNSSQIFGRSRASYGILEAHNLRGNFSSS